MKKVLVILAVMLLPVNFALAKNTIKGEISKIEIDDRNHITTIKLTNIKDGSPVTLDQLKTVHTEKIHLLIIDAGLSDYSHIHPEPTDVPGEYQFDWYPTKMAKYKIWADLLPEESDEPEMVLIDVDNKVAEKQKIDKTLKTEIEAEDMKFAIKFMPEKIKNKQGSHLTVTVYNDDNEPFTDLQPVMGTYGHLVAFSEDFKTVAHIHPMGNEPGWFWETGGPNLSFHFMPHKKGFYKFFLQIKVGGKEIFIPFGAKVN